MIIKKTGNLRMKIIDSHIHLYDNHEISHSHLNSIDPLFSQILGDYASLPHRYLFEDYQSATNHFVSGIVWHEFVSDQPHDEIDWAAKHLAVIDKPYAMVAKIDFSDPSFDAELEFLSQYGRVTAIRQHMAYHPTDPLKRFTNESCHYDSQSWHKNLSKISNLSYKCGLEIFSSQLQDTIAVIKNHSNIQFTIALMGWPYSTDSECFTQWRRQLKELNALDNICLQFSALESIFGMDWNNLTVKPWIDAAITSVGIERCMFGSHSPICNLSSNFMQQLDSYEIILKGLSENEKNLFFYDVAKKWFQVK